MVVAVIDYVCDLDRGFDTDDMDRCRRSSRYLLLNNACGTYGIPAVLYMATFLGMSFP